VLDELGDVAGQDRDEERRGDGAHDATRGLPPGGEQGHREAQLDHAGGDDDDVLVDRQPGRHLRLELGAGEGQVGGAGEQQQRTQDDLARRCDRAPHVRLFSLSLIAQGTGCRPRRG
jgi:hypothetical protein